MKSNPILTKILDTLEASPMAQLSLCSKELFHSNFLAWICLNYPSLGCALFEKFVSEKPLGISQVDREAKNIDLWLHFKSGEKLVIENKVKSIATAAQLEEYSAKVGSSRTSFLLLSLSRPPFLASSEETYTDANGKTWHYLSYTGLAQGLQEALTTTSDLPPTGAYHREVIEDYINYIEALAGLHDYYSVDENSTDCFFEPIVRSDLKKSRFYSGIVKMRYAQLARMLHDKLQAKGLTPHTDASRFWASSSGSILTTSGLTRATGLVDFKYSLLGREQTSPPLTMGVQLQGDQFRLVVERFRANALPAAQAFKAPKNPAVSWFNFSRLNLPCLPQEFPKNDGFNKFGEGFLYRSKRLDRNITPAALVDAILTYVTWIHDNADELRETVGAAA